jgi:glycerol-3-phosphate dehydrogenase
MTVARDRRASLLRRLASERFDLLIVGGGITGAGIARDAALRGLRTALIEADDLASGTSSRSSRLVHGGVRYLEHGHLHLVFESSRERRTLLAIAPHLVRPLRFTWPVYRGARVPRWKLGMGLALYDMLALFRNVAPHRRLSADALRRDEPAVRADGLVGGARYYDAATDDARLTLANAIGALEGGAVVVNHVTAMAIESPDRAPVTVVARDGIDGGEVRIAATVVVNGAGPWSDGVRRLVEPGLPPAVRGTKGAHIAVPRERAGNHEALTILSPLDGRVMFVLPAGTLAIIGTTDTPTAAAPNEVRASRDDVDYLLRSASGMLAGEALGERDVVSAWAGIRPLIATGFHGAPAAASREHRIDRGPAQVVTVTGGKLTTYRAMAAQVVDVVERALGRAPSRSVTASRPLPGGEMTSLDVEIAAAVAAVGREGVARHLVRAYGTRWRRIASLIAADASLGDPIVPGLDPVWGEAVHAVTDEHAWTLADLLVRRTHIAFDTRDHGMGIAPAAAERMAPLLGWDAVRVRRELDAYERDVDRLFAIDAG